jgi:hypothetical protein
MRRLVWITIMLLAALVVLSGCGTPAPLLAQDCEIARYVEMWEGNVDECKMASIRQEDRKIERARLQARKDACVYPLVWTGGLRDGQCRNAQSVIIR